MQSRTFDLKVDPRVTRDGVTQADLDEQVAFQLRVRDAISEARRLQQAIEEALKKAGVPTPGPALPGTTPGTTKFTHPLQGLWARVADLPGIYPQPMLVSQFQNIARMVGSGRSESRQGCGRSLQRSDEGASIAAGAVEADERLDNLMI